MDIETYSKLAPQYFADEAPNLVEGILRYNNFGTILDCGCGDGSLLYYIYKHKLQKKAQVYGIDLSQNRINIAQKISRSFHLKVDSVETLSSVKNKSIDFLISEQVIEHVDDQKMVNTLSRVSRPGAIIYLSTVYKKWYGWYFYRNNIGWVLDPTHLREYTSDSQLLRHFKKDYWLVVNNKTLQWFPVVDFFLKRLGLTSRMRDGKLWSMVRSLKIPIIGYYLWELIFIKK